MRSIPELSSFTSDDIVLVMESAAMRRSFLKFLLGPFHQANKQTKSLTKCSFQKPFWTISTSRIMFICVTCYPEQRPLEHPLPRPWVSPEVCESGSCRQSPSGSGWGSADRWCGWGKSVESRDPESDTHADTFVDLCHCVGINIIWIKSQIRWWWCNKWLLLTVRV